MGRAGILAGLVAVTLVAAASFYTADDHVFFAQVREQPFGLRFLTEPIYDHLSPWHRFNDHVAEALSGEHRWWPAASLAVLWWALTVGAAWLLLRDLAGAGWASRAGIGLVAVSPVFVRSAQWWALAAQALPQLCFGLLAVWAGRRAVRGGGRRWSVVAVLAYAASLAGFVKALLLPLAVVALTGRPRRRDAALWLGVAAVTAGYLAVIAGDRYYRFIGTAPAATSGQWAELLLLGLFGGTVPMVFGFSVPHDPGPFAIVVAAVLNVVLLVLAVATRRAWRAWLAALALAVATLVLSGGARLGEQGAAFVALDPRYPAEGALALQVALVVALAGAAVRPRTLAAAGAAVLVLVAASSARLAGDWVAPRHEAWFAALERSAPALEPGTVVVDGVVPGFLVPPQITGANLVSKIVPLRLPGLSVGPIADRAAWSAPDGRLVAVRLDAPTAVSRRRTCLPQGAVVLEPRAAGGDVVHVLELRFDRLAEAFAGTVVADSGGPNRVAGVELPAVLETAPRIPAGATTWRFAAGAGRLERLVLTGGADRAMCVRAAAVRSFPLP